MTHHVKALTIVTFIQSLFLSELYAGFPEKFLFKGQGGGDGNYSWLIWNGDTSAKMLAQIFVPTGVSHLYVNSNNSLDSKLDVGNSVQGAPELKTIKEIRTRLKELLNHEIILTLWGQVS